MDQAPATTPRGALTPGLAARLDRLSDQGRLDRLLSQHGLNPADAFVAPERVDGQLALFDVSQDGDTLVSFEGETL